jgi:hypothetical protein
MLFIFIIQICIYRIVKNLLCLYKIMAALGGLVVSVLAMGPRGLAAAGSGLAEDGGFLWEVKIHSMHFLWRGSKAISPIL